MSWWFLSIAIGAVVVVSAQTDPRASDALVVPGVRVGPVSRTSTEISLIELLGNDAIKQNVEFGEGESQPGLVIYKDDPSRRLEIVWNRDVPAHPWYVFICRSDLTAPPPPCRWRTADGVGMGTALKELERLNGKPFTMVIWGSDAGGNVVSFDGGALVSFDGRIEREPWNFDRLVLRLEPHTHEGRGDIEKLSDEEKAEVYGSKAKQIAASSQAVLQKLNPYVAEFTQIFPLVGMK
jgi:hypothetical protein